MKKSIWHITIPTPVGLILIVVLLVISVWFAQNTTFINMHADSSTQPQNITVSNITDTSFTVSYFTAEKTTGTLTYGTGINAGTAVIDARDTTAGNSLAHWLHYFTVINAKPDTNYYFTILSGSVNYNDNGNPYTVKTAPAIPVENSNNKEVNGKVVLPDGTYPKEAVIYLETAESQKISGIVLPDGSYHLIINLLRDKNLSQYIKLTDSNLLNISVSADTNTATATTYLKDAANVPVITLSQQYNFANPSPTGPATGSATLTGAIPLPTLQNNQKDGNLSVNIPTENQEFDINQPTFTGNAKPNSVVSLQLAKDTKSVLNASIDTDTSGSWSYTPDTELAAGNYILNVINNDNNGSNESIAVSFVIHASGSKFTDPSVAPLSPTDIPPMPSDTPIPTINTSPTLVPTAQPTATPLVVMSPMPMSPYPTLVDTGSNDLVIAGSLISFATLVSALLFFLIRL